jgi:predicted ester cyclase
MTVEENLRLLTAVTKTLDDHDLDRFLSLHLESVIQRDPQHPEGIKGREAIRAGIEPMLRAFPDLRSVQERAFGEGDWVLSQGVIVGTNTGPLEVPGAPTIPATNRRVRLPFALVAKIDGGKFAEVNVYFDQAGMMAQLGLMPQGPAENEP